MHQTQTSFGSDKSKVRFELSAGEYVSKSFESKDERHANFFAAKNKREKARENFSRSSDAERYAAVGENKPEKLFGALLAQLDRIVCLDEISENLERLDAAVRAGDVKRVGALVRECAEICRDCGMFSVVEPLAELARFSRRNRTARAADLCAQIRREFERRRHIFKTNLRHLAANANSRGAFV